MDPYLQTSSSIPISQKQAQELVIKFKSIFYKCKNSKFRQLFKEKTLKQETLSPYLQAKISQTEQRDLRKALNCYIKAAVYGEKVNTCIKDFASVLHQCGYTEEAIKFLKQMQKYYSGNKQRYSKLVENLKIQLKPSGKHSLKKILIDTKDYFFTDLDIFMSQMFQNKKRIKQVQYYHNLSLRKQEISGSYLLLIFQSFSAAKKTLQTYKNDPGLQFDKYWIDCSSLVACKAIDGKEQFQQSLFFKKGILNKMHGVQITQEAQRKALKLMEQTIENTRKKGGQEDDHFYRNKYIIESIKYYDANYHKEGQQYKNYVEQQQLQDPYQ